MNKFDLPRTDNHRRDKNAVSFGEAHEHGIEESGGHHGNDNNNNKI